MRPRELMEKLFSPWLLLAAAIVAEVIGTSFLKAADGFRHFWASVVVIVGYAAAFYLLSITLRTIPVGIAYAVWAGVGVILITLIGWLVFAQRLDLPAIVGIALIIAGVLILNVYSSSVPR